MLKPCPSPKNMISTRPMTQLTGTGCSGWGQDDRTWSSQLHRWKWKRQIFMLQYYLNTLPFKHLGSVWFHLKSDSKDFYYVTKKRSLNNSVACKGNKMFSNTSPVCHCLEKVSWGPAQTHAIGCCVARLNCSNEPGNILKLCILEKIF